MIKTLISEGIEEVTEEDYTYEVAFSIKTVKFLGIRLYKCENYTTNQTIINQFKPITITEPEKNSIGFKIIGNNTINNTSSSEDTEQVK